jgi:hypothetical protein
MVGQSCQKAVSKLPDTAPPQALPLSPTEDLVLVLPNVERRAAAPAEVLKLFFVLENVVREFVLEALSNLGGVRFQSSRRRSGRGLQFSTAITQPSSTPTAQT